MNTNLKKSIDRAVVLMNMPARYEDYISIKIQPIPSECCCFRCWPKTWSIVNDYISPCGPLKDEGDVLIEKNNEKFVLECHESGPEIVCCVAASVSLISNIINLIITLLKARQTEHRKGTTKLKIIKRRLFKNLKEEKIMEIDFPLSDDITINLNNKLRNTFKNHGAT